LGVRSCNRVKVLNDTKGASNTQVGARKKKNRSKNTSTGKKLPKKNGTVIDDMLNLRTEKKYICDYRIRKKNPGILQAARGYEKKRRKTGEIHSGIGVD